MKNILFVCTGNSARSIIAENIIKNEYSNRFKAYSAGNNPSGKINEDINKFLKKNKNFEDFLNNEIKMDHVVTVCNNANNEVCPIWPEKSQIIHWDIEDPVSKLKDAKNEEKQIIIRNTFNNINTKINNWLNEK